MTSCSAKLAAACALLVLASSPANASPDEQVDVAERLGQPLDRALSFVDQQGQRVNLGSYLGAGRPLLITLNYFRCETLCDLQLQRLARAVSGLRDLPGAGFRMVTVSIDPSDTPNGAAHRRSGYLEQTGRGDLDWRFLVGAEPQIRALADQLGFRYAYDERSDQYAHAPVLFLVSPEGRIVRYLYGIDYPPADLRLALIDASEGRIGRAADKLLLRCFRFDPAAGRYGVYVLGFVRAGAALTVCALVLGFIGLRRAESRRRG